MLTHFLVNERQLELGRIPTKEVKLTKIESHKYVNIGEVTNVVSSNPQSFSASVNTIKNISLRPINKPNERAKC